SGGHDYAVDFGNVNGLGIGNPTCGAVAVSPSNATYSTNYQVTPSYSGFTATSATIDVFANAFNHPGTLSLVEGATAGTMTAVPTSSGSHQFAASASGTAMSRYLGIVVSNANGVAAFPGTAAASGADNTVVTFTLT